MVANLCLGILVLVSLYYDIKFSRIPNVVTMSGIITGFGIHLTLNHWHGLLFSAAGCLAGLFAVTLLYLTRAVGAGDVKLFGAIGALSGAQAAIIVLFYSILYAAVIGLVILVFKRESRQRIGNIIRQLYFLLWFKDISVFKSRQAGDFLTFPFMLAVVPGILNAFFNMR